MWPNRKKGVLKLLPKRCIGREFADELTSLAFV
jgi:hypothetical protein